VPVSAPLVLLIVVVSAAAAASAAAPAAAIPILWAKYVYALVMRLPTTHGLPKLSASSPIGTSWVRVPPLVISFAFGTVRMVPSVNTNVSECSSPRTHPRVQSPTALPLAMEYATSGSSRPFAIKLSLPIITLNE